jgi:rarD protein
LFNPHFPEHSAVTSTSSSLAEDRRGLFYALAAYGIWGFLPIYIKALDHISAAEIFVHRIIWSLLFTGIALLISQRHKLIWVHLSNPRTLLVLFGSTLFIAINWLVFIWAANSGRLLETSLGYYINPLVNILCGLLFLGEKLRRLQWLAVALASAGVALQAITLGSLPYVALILAFAFGLYGLLRKIIKVGALEGLFIETLILTPPSLVYLFYFSAGDSLTQMADSFSFSLFLICAGPLTSVPLMLFAAAVSRLNYSTMGFIQYIAPSTVLLTAVFWFGEVLVWQKTLTFVFIWSALALYSWDSWRKLKRYQF